MISIVNCEISDNGRHYFGSNIVQDAPMYFCVHCLLMLDPQEALEMHRALTKLRDAS